MQSPGAPQGGLDIGTTLRVYLAGADFILSSAAGGSDHGLAKSAACFMPQVLNALSTPCLSISRSSSDFQVMPLLANKTSHTKAKKLLTIKVVNRLLKSYPPVGKISFLKQAIIQKGH